MALSGMVFPEKEIPTSKLKANILCKAHNERLSPLDSAMKTLTENLRAHVQRVAKGPPRGTLLLLNGDDIECALLKMLCGLAASGAVKGLPKDTDPRWMPILYGEEPWPEGWGLYVQQASGGIQDANFDGMSFGFNLAEGRRAHQLGVRFGPWHLVLHVAADDVDAPSPAGFAFRPDLLVAQRGTSASAIHLTYSRTSSGGFVRTTIHS